MAGSRKSAWRNRCRELLQSTLGNADGIIGALVSSADGHVVAQWLPDRKRAGDIAAMSSSLMALAESAAGRTDLSPCRNVIIENDKGNIILLRVNENLTLTCVADREVNLGLQLSASRSCASELAAIGNSAAQPAS